MYKFIIACRLVGLLMVTRALSPNDPSTLRRVFHAIGTQFLSRLLLPLRQNQPIPGEPLSVDSCQKLVATASLGITVISSLVSIDDIACDEDIISLLPVLLSTVTHKGVSPLISSHCQKTLPYNENDNDANTRNDALEASISIALASRHGRDVAMKSGALRAAWTIIWESMEHLSGSFPPSLNMFQLVLWAIRLSYVVLSEPDHMTTKSSCEWFADDMARLVHGLAWAFGLPRSVLDSTLQEKCQSSFSASEPSTVEFKHQQPTDAEASPSLTTVVASVHLEAMRTLLMILQSLLSHERLHMMVWMDGSERERYQAGSSSHHDLQSRHQGVMGPTIGERLQMLQSPWIDNIRRGIEAVFRGKGRQVQRMSALNLSAVMLSICGPEWLCTPVISPSMGQEPQKAGSDEFFQLITETMNIDLNVYMHDAIEPEVRVALRTGTLLDDPSCTGTERTPEASWVDDQQAPFKSSGERALHALPALFVIFEAVVEVLALQSTTENMCLSPHVIHKALQTTYESADVLLQFLELSVGKVTDNGDSTAEKHRFEDSASTAFCSHDPRFASHSRSSRELAAELPVGALRALGRFLSELPDGFASRVRPLLPRLMLIRSPHDRDPDVWRLPTLEDEEDLCGVAFLIPFLLQVTEHERDLRDPGANASLWCTSMIENGSFESLIRYTIIQALKLDSALEQARLSGEEDLDVLLTGFSNPSRVLLQMYCWKSKKILENEASFEFHESPLLKGPRAHSYYRCLLSTLQSTFEAYAKSISQMIDPHEQPSASLFDRNSRMRFVVDALEAGIIGGRVLAAAIRDGYGEDSGLDANDRARTKELEFEAKAALDQMVPVLEFILLNFDKQQKELQKNKDISGYDYEELLQIHWKSMKEEIAAFTM